MPRATPQKAFPLCPEGEDILCKLMAVTEETNDDNALYNPGKVQWKWVFETIELTNEDDFPYKIAYYTGTEYGNEKSKLTKLLDKICRNLTKAEKEELDTDTLTGKKFRLDVSHVVKADGTPKVQVDSIKRANVTPAAVPPVKVAAARAKPAEVANDDDDDEDDADPFDEDN